MMPHLPLARALVLSALYMVLLAGLQHSILLPTSCRALQLVVTLLMLGLGLAIVC